MLGLGTDGHTASLFPNSTALEETARLVTSTWVARLQTHRITFTLPFINNARAVLFLVAGADKAPILAQVLGPTIATPSLPAQRVLPKAGRLLWLVDVAAARLIPPVAGDTVT